MISFASPNSGLLEAISTLPLSIELHRPGTFIRQQCDALHRAGQTIAIELDPLVVALRYDALERRELPVDHSRDEQASTDVEEEVVFATLVADIPLTLVRATGQVPGGSCAADDTFLLCARGSLAFALCLLPRHGNQRQAVPVGRYQAHRIGSLDEQCAVQKISGVFAGDRELGLRHHVLQHIPWKRGGVFTTAVRQRRKVFARQGLHPRVEPIGGDLDAVLVLFDPDVSVRQRLDDLVELLGRQRQRARLGDRRRTAASQADFQIRREQLDLFSSASISTLARIGIVFLRSTMPWNNCSSRNRSALRTTSSISAEPRGEEAPEARLSLLEKRRNREQRIITRKRRCGNHNLGLLVLAYV